MKCPDCGHDAHDGRCRFHSWHVVSGGVGVAATVRCECTTEPTKGKEIHPEME